MRLGPTEILIILGIVVLLFGGRKLPELARGSGRALRIFKSEVKASQDENEAIEGPRDATPVDRSVESAAQPTTDDTPKKAASNTSEAEPVEAEIIEDQPREAK